ncbi:hypothetical protein pEaSNUABM14_00002 [Erwinia phage pEa_SNUABM_14]|uniref:Uncharacterized protein n=1 Tax=Erwinia phage pEa_SNUABM_7 TaxID=2866695 RepID=A0AAE7WT32_9CAUD|nr:hypothetical protein MPK74_gp002 [Erwinia phage pEa_SNUABM_7]QYW02961.1 hypothetical protein pEaSNUABM13_00002 [Erwinia phage pEa_SNUABM_13]QYW03304.1 hypothetical protein pEaSNUABM34_00002 [Erwinia phage pEa_SNUABM_34]QYW03645.1 hypothetical protein pEaSNUABM45_00002 [Erwinia phage pEa_SNUABM_45]QYW03986.1 hypothetical protein pEaSNUABM46_00002 [Erwinia phage pEa_SNUABM_46]QYW04327.1 hypothetical protein pEaSNUABM14_00002 [Erwinia phage pEa_SNUABM_14]QYW05016.1 hypothetical protein pEaSNU
MSDIQLQEFTQEIRDDLSKDFVYHIRTKDGTEHTGMWPNYAGFHCLNPNEGKRISMDDVTHISEQMTFDDHSDKYVFNREKV